MNMKWVRGIMLVMGIVALATVHCGGGDTTANGDNGNGGNGDDRSSNTPDVTSGEAVNAMGGFTEWTFSSLASILGTLPDGGTSTLDENVSCEEWQQVGDEFHFICTILGILTGQCDLTGSYGASGTIFSYVVTYVCVNHNDDGTISDGSWTSDISIDSAKAPAAISASTSSKAFTSKQADSTKQAAECPEEGSNTYVSDEGSCTFEEGTEALCTAENAFYLNTVTVEEGGLTIKDPCGTYIFGDDFSLINGVCLSGNVASTSLVTQGTFNGQVVDTTINASCTVQ